jgi:hypothetical protein
MVNEKKGPMTPEQVENYLRAVTPVQQGIAAAKSARQDVFRSLKNRVVSPDFFGAAGCGQK